MIKGIANTASVLGLGLVLAFGGCTGGPMARGATNTPGASATSAEVKDVATPGTQEAAATAESTPQVLFVANTGGTGVSWRSDCLDGSRIRGDGFKDGTQVTVTSVGTDQCAGWAQVEANGVSSWVHLGYLSPNQPPAVAVAPPRPVTQGPGASAGTVPVAPPPPPSAPRFEKVLVYGEHLIPISQLTYRAADHGPLLLTPNGPRGYVCPAYNYSAPVVRTVNGVTLTDPDPYGCGFARADTAVVREALIQ
jgi:hypothetical protein